VISKFLGAAGGIPFVRRSSHSTFSAVCFHLERAPLTLEKSSAHRVDKGKKKGMAMVDYVGDTSGGVVLELELESASSSPRCKNPKSWVCVTTADVESDSFDVEELTKTVKLKEALGSSSSSLSVTLSRLAVGLHRIGRIVEAKSICCRVVYFETTRAPAAASTSTQSSNLAMAFNNLGCVCFQLGQSMEAQTYLECALAVATDPQAGEENEPAFTAKIRRNLAIYYLNDGGEPQLASHLLGLVLRSKEEQLRETNLEVVDGCTELIDYLDLYAQSLLQCPAMESKKLGEQCYERSLQIAQAKVR
jgi:hypothetical protein